QAACGGDIRLCGRQPEPLLKVVSKEPCCSTQASVAPIPRRRLLAYGRSECCRPCSVAPLGVDERLASLVPLREGKRVGDRLPKLHENSAVGAKASRDPIVVQFQEVPDHVDILWA